MRLVQAALLPAALAGGLDLTPYPVLTWESVREAYSGLAPPYWLAILDEALWRYPDLVSRQRSQSESALAGAEIVTGYQNGTLRHTALGRAGGQEVPRFAMTSNLADGVTFPAR